ncbi:MAG: PAS domain S-box protein [Opitutae bacterium]|nr:PAS domain S-box protein [Opitutae bacterium]
MKGKGLRTRMVLYTVFTTGFALLLAGLGLIFYDSIFLHEQAEKQMESESEVILRVCEPVVAARDSGKAGDIVEAIGLDQHITAVAIYLPDGQMLASDGNVSTELTLPEWPVQEQLIRTRTGSFTEVFQPIVRDEQLDGWVYVKRDSSEILNHRMRYMGILSAILVLSLLLTLASSTWLQSGFVKPVQHLVNIANRVSLEKDYSLRATKMTEDELGQLTDAFNLMLEKVQRRDMDLQDSERRLYQAIDLVPHMMFAKDRSGRFILCNKAVANAYGTTIPKMLSSSHMAMHTGDEKEAIQMLEDDHQVMDAREPLLLEETWTGPGGALRILRTTKIPYTQSGTSEDAILGIAIDITKEKEAERELREAHNELQHVNDSLERRVEERTAEVVKYQQRLISQEKLAAIGQVSGSIAHELRNPLGAIKQSIFFLRRYLGKDELGKQHPKLDEHLHLMDEELSSADHVISSLLDMTRVRKMERSDIELGAMLKEVQSRCQIHAPLKFHIDLDPDPFTFLADPVQFKQVLVNLVQNSRDACPLDGLLQVKGRMDEGLSVCRIEVSDNGSGMNDDQLQSIFEPLYTTKAKGTGLGLSICRQIIEEHHEGKITVESEVDVGTRFIIELPLDKRSSLA